jgi:hypothetical protein
VWNPESLLRIGEDIVPEASLQVALQLGQIKIRPGAAVDQSLRVVEKIEPEIKQAAGNRFAVDRQMSFVEVPAAWPNEQGRRFGVQGILASVRVLERDRAPHRIV